MTDYSLLVSAPAKYMFVKLVYASYYEDKK